MYVCASFSCGCDTATLSPWVDVDTWELMQPTFKDFTDVVRHVEGYLSGCFMDQELPLKVLYLTSYEVVHSLSLWKLDWLVCVKTVDQRDIPSNARC